jgi:hypothetical protein
LSFLKINDPFEARSSRIGSSRRSVRPDDTSDGPLPRRTTDFAEFPVTMNPPIMTLSPSSTRNRVEMFSG